MITNNYSLTINGYECKLNKPLKFYQGDSLHLIFTVNQYEWVINNGNRVRAIMPINPLKAFLIIENPEDEATDTIESAFVENDEIHFHIDSKYTSFVGVGRMQLVLADDGCCSVTIPEFTYEIKKNITDKLLNLSKTTLIDTDNKVLMTDSGDDMITGLALSTESNTSKYIKDLPNKETIDGEESVLIQDQEGTKNVNMKVLLDDINSRTNLADIQNQIAQTNAQLSQDKKELSAKIQEVAETGTTTEVLQDTTKKYIDKKIDDGTIANLTIKDKSITRNKLENEFVADIIDTYSQQSSVDTVFTEEYVASSNHSNQSEGSIVSSPTYQLSGIICLKKANKISFTANTSKNVCTLSKFTKDGVFIKSIFIGNEETVKYSYTVEDEYEFLRVCSRTGNPITDLTVISATSSNREMIQDEITKINHIINFENADVKIDVALESGFIASSNHASGEGTINVSESYVYSDVFTIKKGETIGIKAITSPNAIVLAEYDSSNNFIKAIIVGDEVTNYYEYTATKDVEYLRVCSKVGVDLIVSEINKNLILDKINKAILSSTTASPNSIRKPVINFTIDDGVLTTDAKIYNTFKTKGLVCGFALPTNINSSYFDTYLKFQAEGFEILSHSTDGAPMSDDTQELNVIENKMKSSKVFLEKKGFNITGWVTPSSALNDKYINLLRKYYEYGYTVYLGTWTNSLGTNPYNEFKEDTCRLKRVSLESSTLDNVLLSIDEVCKNGGMLSFYAHGFKGNLTEESLNTILEYVNTKIENDECVVMTPTECYRYFFSLRHNDLVGLL